jgi:protein-tyrosine phosphatase
VIQLERYIPLEGAFNTRDLGGYTTADGSVTRWRTLLRSGSLSRLNEEGQEKLLELGLRTVIDLRHEQETKLYPNAFAKSSAVTYQVIPLIDLDLDKKISECQTLADMYRMMLDECFAQFKEVIETIAYAGDGTVLFHCAAGKDRTGMVSALLLGVLGVEAGIIVDDYSCSDLYLQSFYELNRESLRKEGKNPDYYERYYNSHPQNILSALEYLETRFGGAANYLAWAGVSSDTIGALKQRFVEPRT